MSVRSWRMQYTDSDAAMEAAERVYSALILFGPLPMDQAMAKQLAAAESQLLKKVGVR